MDILSKKYYFFSDVETTGFDPIRNDIVSLCMIVTDEEYNQVGTFYETCRPEFNKFYSMGAEKIHGFNRSKLEDFQPPRKMLINLLNFLAPFRTPDKFHPFVYHANGLFDYSFINWAFRKQELHWSFYKMFDERFTESTVKMARDANYSPNKLNHWADRLGFELKHHNAKSDTECCVQIYKYLDNQRKMF